MSPRELLSKTTSFPAGRVSLEAAESTDALLRDNHLSKFLLTYLLNGMMMEMIFVVKSEDAIGDKSATQVQLWLTPGRRRLHRGRRERLQFR